MLLKAEANIKPGLSRLDSSAAANYASYLRFSGWRRRRFAAVKMKKRLTILCSLLLVACATAAGCNPVQKKAEAHPSPAKVAAVQQEVKLNDIVLTPEAEQRLGITYATVEMKPISRVRSYAGEIALPPGASLVISAPVGGKLDAASSGNTPTVGMLVSANQPLFLLTPLLSLDREVLAPAEKISIAQTKSQI